ncbi:hypothetical protein BDQ17DRAFT_1326141 [Cyathus striatus]|nr:hypothetical protein BDQ17DRAFT_1326141 [Cyathus striatus]
MPVDLVVLIGHPTIRYVVLASYDELKQFREPPTEKTRRISRPMRIYAEKEWSLVREGYCVHWRYRVTVQRESSEEMVVTYIGVTGRSVRYGRGHLWYSLAGRRSHSEKRVWPDVRLVRGRDTTIKNASDKVRHLRSLKGVGARNLRSEMVLACRHVITRHWLITDVTSLGCRSPWQSTGTWVMSTMLKASLLNPHIRQINESMWILDSPITTAEVAMALAR